MRGAKDRRFRPVRAAVLHALNGHQTAAAETLRGLADSDDPYLAWPGCAAWLGHAWWTGRSGEAGDLVERTVARFGPAADSLGLPDEVPFYTAVSAAALYDGADRKGRLTRMLGNLPPGHRLARRLGAGLTDPDPLWGIGGGLRPTTPSAFLDSLPPDPRTWGQEHHALIWSQADEHGRGDVLVAMYDAGYPIPEPAHIRWYVAQALLAAGRPADGAGVIAASRATWLPYYWWETLPAPPALHPALRPMIDQWVQQEFFTRPIHDMTWT